MAEHLRDLTSDPRNARRHDQRNIGMIEAALREVGASRSIVVDEDGVVLAGNATVEAAVAAGIERVITVDADGETIIAVRRTGLTPEQKTKLALYDNRTAELADWDTDVLASLSDEVDLSGMFFDDELAELLAGLDSPATLGDPDAVPDPPAEPITKPGDLWLLGEHRLLCGDSTVATDVDRLMGEDQADLVWTDPPYGVAIGDKNKWLNSVGRSNRIEQNLTNDTLDEVALLQMLRSSFTLIAGHCVPGASWYVAAPAGPLHLLFGQALNELGIFRQTIQWVKNNATFSPMGVSYHWQAEPIFYGWLPNAAKRFYGDRKQTTVWEIDRPQKSPDHPTTKPVALVLRSIEHTTRTGDIVVDPFLGSGTTIIAAEQTGRTCHGLEIDPAYCDVIVARWETFTGRTATLDRSVAEVA